jgi:small subunit ribosomal protein S3e
LFYVSYSISGVLGVKVAIMLPHDPTGVNGPKKPQPDVVKVHKPKDEDVLPEPAYGQTVDKQ